MFRSHRNTIKALWSWRATDDATEEVPMMLLKMSTELMKITIDEDCTAEDATIAWYGDCTVENDNHHDASDEKNKKIIIVTSNRQVNIFECSISVHKLYCVGIIFIAMVCKW